MPHRSTSQVDHTLCRETIDRLQAEVKALRAAAEPTPAACGCSVERATAVYHTKECLGKSGGH